MSKVEVKQVTKNYGNAVAVNAVSLTVNDGECLALIGPSGAGKTTILRLIAGLEKCDAGEIRVDGVNLSDKRPHERNMAMIFQDGALFPHTKVKDNIIYGLSASGFTKEETEKKCQEMATLLHIEALLDRFPETLSAGEKQRVGIARALVRQPKVLLLDEPFAALDARLQDRMHEEIRQLRKQLNQTMILVTHDQKEAVMMADRIAFIENGALIACDQPAVLYDRPMNIRVASFIGQPQMNLVTVENGRWLGQSGYPENTVIGFRASDITDGDRFSATMESCYREENRWHCICNCTGQTIHLLLAQADVPQTVTFDIPEDKLHYFDAVTGNRRNK